MDSLTHTVLGACMGEAIAGKKIGKKAMLIGALAHNAPDMDMVYNFFTTPISALLTHRGITHSIFFNTLFCFALVWLFKRWIKNPEITTKNWFLLIGSGLLTHIVLDSFTTYGTGWFEPFSHYRVSLNILFILDPFLMFPLLVIAITLLILKKTNSKRAKLANIAMTISALYLCMTIFNKIYSNNKIENKLESNNITYTGYTASPTPLNSFLFYTLVRRQNDFLVTYYSVFDDDKCFDYEIITRNDSVLKGIKDNPEIQKFIRFSKGYYNVYQKDSCIMITDMRFGQLGGWAVKNTEFVFNYDITQNNRGEIVAKQSQFKKFESDVFGKLYKRIKGINCN